MGTNDEAAGNFSGCAKSCAPGTNWTSPFHRTASCGAPCRAGHFCVRFCRPCGLGMVCEEVGLSVESLPIQQGWWRVNLSSPRAHRCFSHGPCAGTMHGQEGNVSSQNISAVGCKLGNMGPCATVLSQTVN